MNVNLLKNIFPSVSMTISVVYLSIFKLGKIIEFKHNDMIISSFQYRLEKKREHISPTDILLNFGGKGTKSVFVFSEKNKKL